jgi:hypothetical protein
MEVGKMIYPDYPMAQELKLLFKSGLKDFERYLQSILFYPSETIIEASQHGLFIFSKNEEALERPVEVLDDIFRDAIRSAAPQVRYFRKDHRLYEPIMHLRVNVNNHFSRQVEEDLLKREAVVFENDKVRNGYVLRAEGPLRNLIGYKNDLNEITDHSAHCLSWLDRYSPWRTC